MTDDFDIDLTDQQRAYLTALIEGETTVKHAALEAGIHPVTPYGWRKNVEGFAEIEDICRELSFDDIVQRVNEFAVDGVPVQIMAGGQPVWAVDDEGDFLLDDDFERIPLVRREHKVEYAKLALQTGGRIGKDADKIGVDVTKGKDGDPDTIKINIVRPDPNRFNF